MLWTCKVVAVGLALSLAGCSIATKTNVKGSSPHRKPQCNSSYVAPVIDTATVLGLGAYEAHGLLRCSGEECFGPYVLIPWIAVVALPYAISAVFGYWRTNKCRRSIRKHAEWRRSGPQMLR